MLVLVMSAKAYLVTACILTVTYTRVCSFSYIWVGLVGSKTFLNFKTIESLKVWYVQDK